MPTDSHTRRWAWTTLVLALCLLLPWAAPSLANEDTAPPSCEKTGPQSPRDIDDGSGSNPVRFTPAPAAAEMRLCDIHFHKYAEHKAAAYSTPAGTGNHHGWACTAPPPAAKATGHDVMDGEQSGCGGIVPGDTIEIHHVYTTCLVEPGPKLDSCFSPTCANPALRVEARIWVLGDGEGLDQPDLNRPRPAGPDPFEYSGSTTGPKYDNQSTCSPFQVTWRVDRECAPLAIGALNDWCDANVFDEDHAHEVRKLVSDPGLLSYVP